MTHPSVPNIPTGLSTQMHIAMHRGSIQRRPTYSASFGLAAMLLSIVGVDGANDIVREAGAADSAVVVDEARRSILTEWDEWKSVRDLG